jgi:hypothetical protein
MTSCIIAVSPGAASPHSLCFWNSGSHRRPVRLERNTLGVGTQKRATECIKLGRPIATKLAWQYARIRITGWHLYDQEHPEQIGKFRATLWEIHPIMKIEFFMGGTRKELRGI